MSNSILDSTPAGFPERLFISALDHKPMERVALRALMKATRLLSLALGQRLAEMRTSDDAKENALAMTASATIQCQVLREVVDLLGERFDKLPVHQRPHYKPTGRFRIVTIKNLLGLSQIDAAKLFRISPSTIKDWETNANRSSRLALGHHLDPRLPGVSTAPYRPDPR
jgi:DNA-binding transcriptional regulator YiaG